MTAACHGPTALEPGTDDGSMSRTLGAVHPSKQLLVSGATRANASSTVSDLTIQGARQLCSISRHRSHVIGEAPSLHSECSRQWAPSPAGVIFARSRGQLTGPSQALGTWLGRTRQQKIPMIPSCQTSTDKEVPSANTDCQIPGS